MKERVVKKLSSNDCINIISLIFTSIYRLNQSLEFEHATTLKLLERVCCILDPQDLKG